MIFDFRAIYSIEIIGMQYLVVYAQRWESWEVGTWAVTN